MSSEKNDINQNFKDRKFMLLLYTDNPEHMRALEHIKKNYDYAAILHNKDEYEEDVYDLIDKNKIVHHKGELKKEHYHVIVRWKTDARWRSAFADELGISDPRFLGKKIGSIDRALEYLIHYNERNKYHYEIKEVSGPLKKRLLILINRDDRLEEEQVLDIISYLDENQCYISYRTFLAWCATNNLYTVVRRAQMLYIKLLDEHNKKFENQ